MSCHSYHDTVALGRPPAASTCAKMRRPRRSTFLAAFSSRSSARTHTLHRWTRSGSLFGTRVPARERSCDVPAGGTSTKGMPALAFQNVEELSPTLLSDGPVQASLVLALANHVADLQRFNHDEVVAVQNQVGEAMEFLPSRLRLPFLCPLRRRLLLAAALRTSPAARHRALLPADCASHRRLPLALHMSAIGKGGKAPDARIQPPRAFRRVRVDCRQMRSGLKRHPRAIGKCGSRTFRHYGSGRAVHYP